MVMGFLIVGVLLLVLKLAEVGAVAAWSWWAVLAPFALAVAWWGLSDKAGLTQRRAMDKMERKKELRRQRNLEALGLTPRRGRPVRPPQSLPSGDSGRRAAKDPTHAE
jgi:small Trp-rich protein